MVRRVAYQEAGELNWYQPHAHSQYFQTAAEFGVVGLLAGLVAFAVVAWLLVGAIRGADPERRRWAWASLFGLVYLGLNVFVDTHTIPTVALLMGLPIAVLDATSVRGLPLPFLPARVTCWLRNLAVVLLSLACLASFMQLVRSESVALTHARAVAAIGSGDWDVARTAATEAAQLEPEIGAYWVTAAVAAAQQGDWVSAEDDYRSAIAIDRLPQAWLGLARARAEQGRPAEDVVPALREALRLGEQEPALALAAAQVYDMVGETDSADATFAHVIAELPSIAADEAWRAYLGAERFDRVVDIAVEAAPEGAWEIALMAGRHEQARQLAGGLDDDWRQAYISAWDGDALPMKRSSGSPTMARRMRVVSPRRPAWRTISGTSRRRGAIGD